MRNFIINFFFPQSVAGVMAQFQKTIDDLHKVAAIHMAKANKYDEKVEKLEEEIERQQELMFAADSEAQDATRLATKLSATFGLAI
jgi:hypothetical protein